MKESLSVAAGLQAESAEVASAAKSGAAAESAGGSAGSLGICRSLSAGHGAQHCFQHPLAALSR